MNFLRSEKKQEHQQSTITPGNRQDEWDAKLQALMNGEAQKMSGASPILLGVQTKDQTYNFRYATGIISDTMSTNEPYFIASQTKMFTASIIFQLIDEGKMQLSDPMHKHLPPLVNVDKLHVYRGKDYSRLITVQDLLHQTSGLPDYFLEKAKLPGMSKPKSIFDSLCEGNDVSWTLSDVLERAKALSPKFVPGSAVTSSSSSFGTRSFYSDTNYQLLGAIIEHVTGQSIRDNLVQRIFDPIGLSSNTYLYQHEDEDSEPKTQHDDATTKQQKSPMCFSYKDKECQVPKMMSSFGPDGGIVSTMDDMLAFLRAYFDGTLFNVRHHEQAIQVQWNNVLAPPLLYGLGLMKFQIPKWMTLYLFDAPVLLGHSGANASFAFYNPDQELFLVGTFKRRRPRKQTVHVHDANLECIEKVIEQ